MGINREGTFTNNQTLYDNVEGLFGGFMWGKKFAAIHSPLAKHHH